MENSNKNNVTKDQIWFGIGLVILMIVGFALAGIFPLEKENTDLENSIENIEKQITIEKAPTEYERRNSFNKKVIISDFSNTAKNNRINKSAKKTFTVEGEISKGYLYVVASSDGKALNDYSDVYLKIGASIDGIWKESGGHLLENRSLETPKGEKRTELLFDLSDVKFKESYNDSDIDIVSGNWLKLINQDGAKVTTAFSSTEQQGLIEEISIYYECENTEKCNISLK